MNKLFYPKLAAGNIKKNARIYIPYLLTCIFTIAMYYVIHSLSMNEGLNNMRGGQQMQGMLEFGRFIIGVFAAVFLFYTNSFLMKRRKKEIGLWNILGMEKRHIMKVIGYETLYIMLISLTAGLLLGILLEKGTYLILARLFEFDIVLGFHIYGGAILVSCILFGIIFFAIFLNSLWQVSRSKPIELLRGGMVGEKEPKTKWFMAVLGILCLATAYTLSICLKDPLESLAVFFVAVLLVIAGTELLFVAGSIAFLKLLRKNKNYYYKAKHFTSVSNMLYRMKRNAVGLANICILVTMILVMLSSTSSLVMGEEDIIHNRYPNDFSITEHNRNELNPELQEIVNREIEAQQLEVKKSLCYSHLQVMGIQNGSEFETDMNRVENYTFNGGNACYLIALSLDDYNRILGTDVLLQEDEILLYSPDNKYRYDTMDVFGKTYRIAENLDEFLDIGTDHVLNTYYLVVRDWQEIQHALNYLSNSYEDTSYLVDTYYGYDLIGTPEAKEAAFVQIRNQFLETEWNVVIFTHENARRDFMSLHGSLFFLGIFLSILFVMAVILVIYYKQISEAYEDKERYQIMQKVGMSQAEVRQSIHSQILTVFFLPLITAGIHVAFALPIIIRMLKLFGFFNTSLFVICALICFLIFAVLYGIIYSITAKAYYKIVSWN